VSGRRDSYDLRVAGAPTTLIFLHIPKAAGTTLHNILARQYPPQATYTVDGAEWREDSARFAALPPERKRGLALVKGHMNFGLHETLEQPATYITILRDPVERVISSYYYVLRTPAHFLHAEVVGTSMGLREFIERKLTIEHDNGQTRMLAPSEAPFGECPPEGLDLARRHLEQHFASIGLSERFDESLLLLRRALGWRWPVYARANVTVDRPPREGIDDDVIEMIEADNRLDRELYRFAVERFEAAVAAAGTAFDEELRRFRRLNFAYRAFRHFLPAPEMQSPHVPGRR
jgi:Galactose-3-O-sulfotransferase